VTPRRYAQDTTVSAGKSRGEIDDLLRRWGCRQIAWAEDYEQGRVMLQFVWRREDQDYLARFSLSLPTEDELRELAIDGRSGRPSEVKFRKLEEARGRAEHRQLALLLKAAFNAVEAGIIEPEQLFLSFLVGRDGRTVGEVALPRLSKLLSSGSAQVLLGG